MSITLIAITGILVGFLCLVIGFFMEDSNGRAVIHGSSRVKRVKPMKKKVIVHYKKAA
jgi:hypothetical protein